ncbi:MAG: hypothetical protein H6730_25630 [Deltaproteobacteria bacterium]|nr:hypothetical protein [Deltaproteobacteria bacterium]
MLHLRSFPRQSALTLVAVLGAAACGVPSPSGEPTPADIAARYRHDDSTNQHFSPNPEFVAQPADYAVQRQALTREGEVLIIEGGAGTVTVGGPGAFGITQDNQVAIVQEVLSQYPDVFDTIQIYTTFIDQAHQGIAYYQGIQSAVSGIGIAGFDNRAGYGLTGEGRLSGFSNMNSMLQWGNGSFNGLNTIEGYYHGVIAHELSHRWLFHVLFTDPSGNSNSSLLGRDDAHWSRLAHAYGSVHDGNFFVDNGDGSFTNMGTDMGFSPLELYAMGRIPADDGRGLLLPHRGYAERRAPQQALQHPHRRERAGQPHRREDEPGARRDGAAQPALRFREPVLPGRLRARHRAGRDAAGLAAPPRHAPAGAR